jgi:hypothetical protein
MLQTESKPTMLPNFTDRDPIPGDQIELGILV